MRFNFIAQSGFIIELSNNKKIGIDLWLNNSVNPLKESDIPKLDYVFNTHDHGDHATQTCIDIANRDDAWFTAVSEIGVRAIDAGVEKVERANIGGPYQLGDLTVVQTQCWHSSDTSIPVGFIIQTNEGTIWHMGDTGFYSDVEYYAKWYPIDILLIPIGSRYTMDAKQAAEAVKLINPQVVIPIHYNTSDRIQQDPKIFVNGLKDEEGQVVILEPGGEYEFKN
jgi:L-ascorbate metabolism protein UlaG (beta-lactamase superfamily)